MRSARPDWGKSKIEEKKGDSGNIAEIDRTIIGRIIRKASGRAASGQAVWAKLVFPSSFSVALLQG
jgi:hypothetical protein